MARIFNTYGPRMHPNDGRVVSNFIVQALRGQELTLYGTGEQTRSFCYVDDLVAGLVRLMAAEGRHELHIQADVGHASIATTQYYDRNRRTRETTAADLVEAAIRAADSAPSA